MRKDREGIGRGIKIVG